MATLNATVGAIDANSYVTLAEAADYMASRIHFSAAWTAFVDKDKMLMSCSQMLDWYVKFKGIKASETQSMAWPRVDVIDQEGFEISSLIIPPKVKIAVYELAIETLSGDRTGDDPLAGISKLQVSSLMIAAGQKPKNTTKKAIPDKIYDILYGLYSSGAFTVRLLRA